jgi:hypothetical protein
VINAMMRLYNYSTIGSIDEYGQEVIDNEVKGQVKMAINLTSQTVQDNINYKDAQYIGLTHAAIDDTYIIHFGDERLKVLYVNPFGRYKQVFLQEI